LREKCYHTVGVGGRDSDGHPPRDSLQELLAVLVHLAMVGNCLFRASKNERKMKEK